MPDYTPTFAELCSAIADGGVIATLDGSVYEVNALNCVVISAKLAFCPVFHLYMSSRRRKAEKVVALGILVPCRSTSRRPGRAVFL